jgi:hypothetical protein
MFGLWTLLAVALAGVIVGGLAGFGLHAVTDSDDRDGRMVRFGPGRPGFQGGPGGGQFPQPPQDPPSQAPTEPPTQAPSQGS